MVSVNLGIRKGRRGNEHGIRIAGEGENVLGRSAVLTLFLDSHCLHPFVVPSIRTTEEADRLKSACQLGQRVVSTDLGTRERWRESGSHVTFIHRVSHAHGCI